MTIAFGTAGAWATVTVSPIAPALPASLAAGDMMVMFIQGKGFAVTPSTPAGWTQLWTSTEGSVAVGVDVGSMRTTGYYREWQSGDAAPSVTVTSVQVFTGIILRYTQTAGSWATPIGQSGGDTVSDATLTITTASLTDITSGDMLVAAHGTPSDASLASAQAITATSATIGTAVEQGEINTVSGNDMSSAVCDAACTAGTASAAAVYTATLAGAASRTGAGGIIRLREAAGAATARPVQRVYGQAIQTASTW